MKLRYKSLISFILIAVLMLSLSITAFALSDAEYMRMIDEQKKAWDRAHKAGDEAGKKAANEAANKIREQQGQKTSSDGSADERYNNAKIEDLKNTNQAAYKQLADEIAKGKTVKIHVEDSGSTRYYTEPETRTSSTQKTPAQMTTAERQKYASQVPSTNAKGQPLNMDLYLSTGVIAYGSVALTPNDLKNGQQRYYGYDANGNLYVNSNFPPDADSGRMGYEKSWLSVDQIASNSTARNLIGYNSSGVKNYEQLLADAQKLLDTNPKWKGSGLTPEYIAKNFVYQQGSSEYGGGSFLGVHRDANGKLWYQAFSIPSNDYYINIPVESTVPGVSVVVDPPKDTEKPGKSDDTKEPSNPSNPKDPNNPNEPKEPDNPSTPKEEEKPSTPTNPTNENTIARINIYYKCKTHGIFDSDSVNLQVTKGKTYNVKIPAKNFSPKHKLVDSLEKTISVSYTNNVVDVIFLYEDYFVNGIVLGVVRPHQLKSGYGFEVEADFTIETNFEDSEISGTPIVEVNFLGDTYRLERKSGDKLSGTYHLPYNPDSRIQSRKIYTEAQLKDGEYDAQIIFKGLSTPLGPIQKTKTISVGISGHMYEDDYTKPNR